MEEQFLPPKIISEVGTIFHSVVEVLGEAFSQEQFFEYIQFFRKRPLWFKRVSTQAIEFNTEWLGLCCAASDADIILIREGMGEVLEFSTVGHEGGHLLAEHVIEIPLSAEQVLQNPAALVDYIHFSEIGELKDEKEIVAEELGVFFTECLVKNAYSLPDFAQQLYGSD